MQDNPTLCEKKLTIGSVEFVQGIKNALPTVHSKHVASPLQRILLQVMNVRMAVNAE